MIRLIISCISLFWLPGGSPATLPAGRPEMAEGVNESNLNWIRQVTQKYSPNSWHLLEQYEKLPQKQEISLRKDLTISIKKTVKTFHYLNGNDKTELLLAMSTNVHEISHAFFRTNTLQYARDKGIQLNWDNAEGYIYLSPSSSFFISVPRRILFPSRKLEEVIPERMKTFRFSTYIHGNTSTQDEGVIGLLNEFHAYYLGSKYTYDMLEAYKHSEGRAKGIHYWVSHSQSIMTAYYEFDYFIKEYLRYMKVNFPSGYKALKSNTVFWQAYMSIRREFGTLINHYEKTLDSQMKILNESGKAEAVLENGTLWITPEGSRMRIGTSVFSEDKDKVVAILNTDRYKLVEEDFTKASTYF